MAYSNDDIKELCLEADKILINGNKYNDKVASLEDLQNRLRRKAKFKEVNFQDECEGGNSLGNLLVKYATENNNSCVKDLFLNNGFKLPQQEQVVVVTNEEEEQSTPGVEENEVDSNVVDHEDIQFSTLYDKMKFIVQDPEIDPQKFYEELKKGEVTDGKIFDSLADAISSERHDVSEDYAVFLKIVKLFTQLDIRVKRSSGGRTMLDIAVTNEQSEVVEILLDSGKFNEEEKLQALNNAIVQGNVQGFKVFLDYIDHAKILEALNKASCNENTDIMKVFLDNKRFTEQEKVEALSDAVVGGNAPRVKLLLNHMKGIPEAGMKGLLEIEKESKLSLEKELKIDSEFKRDPNNSNHRKYFSTIAIIALLESAIKSGEKEKQKTSNVKENKPEPSSNNRNVNNKPIATVPPISTNNNYNNEILVVTEAATPSVKRNTPELNRVPTTSTKEVSSGKTAMPSSDANGFTNAQFPPPNEKETKESKKNFHTSLAKDVVGVVITGLFIAAAVMVPSVAGAVVCGIVAALALIATGLHIKSSTLPSYREMEANRVEHVIGCHPSAPDTGIRKP